MKRILISILFFFVLSLFQTTFLVHFNLFGLLPNLVLISVIVFNFLENSEKKTGIIIAGIGGLFLDIFSSSFLGVSILILVILAYLIKKFLWTFREENIIYFIPVFIASFFLYELFYALLNGAINLSFNFPCLNKFKLFEILYNLGVGALIYYIAKICFPMVLKK